MPGKITLPAPPVHQRPLCPNCSKRLRPAYLGGRLIDFRGSVYADREWSGVYHGYGAFCSTRCCVVYANAMFKRISGGGK